MEVVILTIKGWDGSRILGVYSCMSEAKACQDSFVKDNSGSNRPPEEFEFDVINIDHLSIGSTITVSTDNTCNTLTRKHVYEGP
jgi:hypothetical protein|tara:strand:+ start:715 stop:966 length:252 start_codon:yes stop_codon:yes gene_type:complete